MFARFLNSSERVSLHCMACTVLLFSQERLCQCGGSTLLGIHPSMICKNLPLHSCPERRVSQSVWVIFSWTCKLAKLICVHVMPDFPWMGTGFFCQLIYCLSGYAAHIVSFPDPFRKNREGVWQHVTTLRCPKGIQSVTQSRVNVYTREWYDVWPAGIYYLWLYAVLVCGPLDHGAMSVPCLACGGEAVARDRRVLHSSTASNIVAVSSNIDRC